MHNKSGPGLLALLAFLFLLPFTVVPSRVAGFSRTVSVRRELPGADPATQTPVILTDQQEEYTLGPYLEILEDPGGELTIDQVSSPAFNNQFVPSQAAVPNYGFTNSAYWVRFSLDNQTRHTLEWLLEVNFANMHYVDLYTPLPGGEGYAVKQSGMLRPVSTRDVTHPQIVFSLLVSSRDPETLYMRFQNGASMTLGLTLWTRNAFLTSSQWQYLEAGLFFGVLLGLLIYNLFLLLSLRDVNYLYFVIELAATIFFVASYDGYTALYLIPNFYSKAEYAIALSFALLLLSIILFADSFLEVKSHQPRLHSVHLVLIAGWGALLLLVPFASYHFMIGLALPLALVSLIVILAAGITSFQGGFRYARIFLIAWAGLLIALFIVILVRMGDISVTTLNENLFRLGMLWLSVSWSIALADRINALKDETETANRDLRQSQHELSQILEGMPLGVVLYGSDQKPRYTNERTVEILSDPSQGIRLDLSQERTLAEAIRYYSFKVAGRDQEYPLENFPPFNALQGKVSSIDDLEMDQGEKKVPLEIWASPIKDDAGIVNSAVVAFQDISERKQAEAELVEYRRHLEALVGRRTAELNAANQELRLRLEWMSAIVLVTETMTRTSDFTQIYENIIEIIHRLFAVQDCFIAEFDPGSTPLKILAHSCHGEDRPGLKDSFTTLPENVLADPSLAQRKLVFVARDQLNTVGGPLGSHLKARNTSGIALVPLQLREQLLGFLGLEMPEEARDITSEESNLLGIFSLDIAHLIEDSRLFEQSRALITAEERNRLARDLHDSVTQTLFTASVLADITPRIWEKDPLTARENMDQLLLLIRGALAEMRSMLIELRSGDVQNQTLDQLLNTLVEGARARSHASITLSIVDVPELPKDVILAFYRIAREALNNALVHASASRIHVSLSAEAGLARLCIEDDGSGFDPQEVSAGHLGIRIMAERAAQIGSGLQIHSEPGRGTKIVITWPDKE
jgi:signal transduction histidine kinase